MADKVIKHSDLFKPNVLEPTLKEFKEFEQVVLKLEKGLKNLGPTLSKGIAIPKNAKELEEFNSGLQKINDTQKTAIELEKIKAKISLSANERRKAIREQVKDELGLTNEYQRQSKRLNDLRNAYKNLALQNRENGKVAKGLKQEIDVLDKSLKSVDATVGQHQRNVGNYASALEGLGGSFGRAIGAANAFGAATLKLLKNPLVLLLASIVAGLTALTSAFKSTDEGANDFDSILKSISNTLDVVKTRLGNFASGLKDFFTGNFTQGAEKMSKAFDDIGTQIKEAAQAGREYVLALDEIEDAEIAFISRHSQIANRIAKLEFFAADSLNSPQSRIKALEEVLKLSAEVAKEEEKIATEKFNLEVKNLSKTRGLTEEIIKQQIEFSKQNEKLQTSGFSEEEILKLEELFVKIQEANARIFEENKKNNAKLSNLIREFNEAELAVYDKQFSELLAKYKKDADDKIKENQRKLDAEKKLRDDIQQANLDNLETDAELSEDEIKIEEARYQKELQLLYDNASIEFRATEQFKKSIELLEKKHEKNLTEIKVNEEIKRAELINDAVFQGLNERSDKQQKSLNDEIERRDKAISEQQARAAAGLENTLLFEQQKRDEAALKLKESEEREAKRKELQELGDLFLTFLQERAKDDPNSAASRALADTLVAKAIKKSIAGFYVGTEDTGTVNSPIDNKGGRLAILHDNERVMTKEQNKLIGSMTNNELAMLAYRSNLENKGNKNISGDAVVINLLSQKLSSLENTIKNKKEINISWDTYGARIEEVVENGMKTVYRHITTGKKRI